MKRGNTCTFYITPKANNSYYKKTQETRNKVMKAMIIAVEKTRE